MQEMRRPCDQGYLCSNETTSVRPPDTGPRRPTVNAHCHLWFWSVTRLIRHPIFKWDRKQWSCLVSNSPWGQLNLAQLHPGCQEADQTHHVKRGSTVVLCPVEDGTSGQPDGRLLSQRHAVPWGSDNHLGVRAPTGNVCACRSFAESRHFKVRGVRTTLRTLVKGGQGHF